MKKTLPVLLSILAAVGIVAGSLVVFTGPAQAASCVSGKTTKYTNKLVDDDEVNAYMTVYTRVYWSDCGSYKVLRSLQVGFMPNTLKNAKLTCASIITQKVRFNPSSVGGYNAGEVTLPCKPKGDHHLYDFADRRLKDRTGDRTVNTTVKIIKNNFWDYDFSTPQMAVPN